MRYAKPKSLDEAIALLGDGSWRLIAGGTDFYPAQGTRPIRDDVLDLNALDELRGISETQTHYVFGARTSWSEFAAATHLPPAFEALRMAAREVGSIQVQNTGTIAGNLCNASPAADGVPPLLVLDAEVELRSASGARHLSVGEFILGNRLTARRPDELVTAVRVPKAAAKGRSHFVKLGARRYLVISIAMTAVRVVSDASGRIEEAAIAVGACSPVAQRIAGLEAAMKGAAPGELEALLAEYSFDELQPIDDVRATADYRRQAAREIVSRAVLASLREETGRAAA